MEPSWTQFCNHLLLQYIVNALTCQQKHVHIIFNGQFVFYYICIYHSSWCNHSFLGSYLGKFYVFTLKSGRWAWAVWLSWLGHHPVVGSITGLDTGPGCRFHPGSEHRRGCFSLMFFSLSVMFPSLSLSPSVPISFKINRHVWGEDKI